MIYQRGNPRDYDELAEMVGDDEWRYENLLQFFKKSEDYHGNYPNGLRPILILIHFNPYNIRLNCLFFS
jgi:choline dehydrogenase-like flavoprotein